MALTDLSSAASGVDSGSSDGSGWSSRCLDAARWSAIAVVVCAPVSTALTSLCAGVMLLAWLLSGRAHHLLAQALRIPAGRALALFLLVAATGLFYGVADPRTRLDEFISWRRLAYALPLLCLFWAPLWKWRFVKAFVAMAAIGMAGSYLSAMGWIPAKSGQDPGILLQNHATQGITFALCVLCTLHWARTAGTQLRWGLLALAVALGANIILVTPARSGYLALAVALMAWAWSLAGWRRALLACTLIVTAMAGAYLAAPVMRERVDVAVNEVLQADSAPHLTSMGARVLFYRTAWELIQQRPLLGYGAGGFGVEYTRIVTQRHTDWRSTPSSDPHNIYLMLLVSHGAVGLLAFGGFLYTAVRHAPRDSFGWIGIGSLLMITATSLFSSHFRTFPEGHLIGMFVGAMLGTRAIPDR